MWYVALEDERTTVCELQRKLKEAMDRTNKEISKLSAKLDELQEDLKHKSQTLDVDEMWLQAARDHQQTHLARYVSSSSTPHLLVPGQVSARRPLSRSCQSLHSTQEDNDNAGLVMEQSREEEKRQLDSHRLSSAAEALEEVAMKLRSDNLRLLARCKRHMSEARETTNKALQARIAENQQMMRRIQDQIERSQRKIEHTIALLSEIHEQIEHLGAPIGFSATYTSWRMMRTPKEQHADPATNVLEDHEQSLRRLDEELRLQEQDEQHNLSVLQVNRSKLIQDLKDKTAALQVDRTCVEGDRRSCPVDMSTPSVSQISVSRQTSGRLTAPSSPSQAGRSFGHLPAASWSPPRPATARCSPKLGVSGTTVAGVACSPKLGVSGTTGAGVACRRPTATVMGEPIVIQLAGASDFRKGGRSP